MIDASIVDYNDDFNLGRIVYQPILTTSAITTYPFIENVVLSSASDPHAIIVSAEPVTFTIAFNRNMDTTVQPSVSFGPDIPLTDYTIHPINGGWADARTWQGTFNITPVTGDGYQLIRVAGAVAADDPWLVTGDDAGRFRFEIITSGTEAMNLQANGGEGFVDLSWTQDDFDLLSGFNLYRATSQDGSYTRVNASIIPPDQRSYQNSAVQPGQPYFYKFTIVKSDMSESDFSNVATATPVDTIAPVISHTPVTSAQPGLGFTLAADVTDNVGVQGVTLFYRRQGAPAYSSVAMLKTTGNRYTTTIPTVDVTSPGLDYYLSASDGVSTVTHARPEYPHQVAVVDRPVVTAVSPNRGPATGGTALTVAGSNFKAGASVSLGGALCGGVTVVSSSQITCTTPPHFPGVVDVTVTNLDGQSGVLLRGYTYESDTATLSLPSLTAGQHTIAQAPINVANVQGLVAAELKVTFDPAVLTLLEVTSGNLTPGWTLDSHTPSAGQVVLALISPGGPVSGSGVLVNLAFDVIGAPGGISALQPSNVIFNDGSITVDSAPGSVTVDQVYSIGGAVHFWAGAAISGTLLSVSGDRAYSASSNASGAFTLAGVSRGNYTLTPSKSDDVRGISAWDVSLVLQHAVGRTTLTGNAATAADVNKSGAINSMDAYYIMQKATDLLALPFPGAGIVWQFTPATRSYTDLGGNQSDQNFTGILLGDVSGNWASAVSAAGVAGPPQVMLQAPTLGMGGVVTIPVRIEPLAPLYSLEFTVDYSGGAALEPALTALSDGWMVSANRRTANQMRVAMASAYPIDSAGDVLLLRFQTQPDASCVDAQITVAVADETPIGVAESNATCAQRVYLPAVAR